MAAESDREIEGEITRAESVKYLQGAPAHAIGSIVFLVFGGVVFWSTGLLGIGLATFASAFLLSANGLSIHAWNRVRDYVVSRNEDEDDTGPTRELAALSLSTEHKAELTGGLVQAGGLIGVLLVGGGLFRLFGPRIAVYLIAGLIMVGNIGALLRVWRTTSSG